MIYVIGSGPAGISAAVTLVAAGLPVTLLDGGVRLEDDKQSQLDKLKTQTPSEWDQSFLETFTSRVVSDKRGVQIKYAYGSDFPYAEVDEQTPTARTNVGHLTPSLATGGFSHVWGAAVLPFTAKEIADWPIALSDLEPHYRSVFSFLPFSGQSDALEDLFPLYGTPSGALRSSAQAGKLFAKLDAHRSALAAGGLHSGLPRLAVDAAGCVYSGLCLSGCPRGVIYSCDRTLELIARAPNFRHLPGMIVHTIAEIGSEIRITAIDRRTKQKHEFTGDAVFLGAGVLSTARILLRSFPNAFPSREVKVSEYFLLPLIQNESVKGAAQLPLHTLSQIFLECLDAEISEQSIHMQLYTYSNLFDRALTKMLRLLGPVGTFIKGKALERLLAMQGYLHSDISSRIALSLDGETLRMDGRINPEGKAAIHRLTKKLWRLRKMLGFTPIFPQLHVGLPGEGRHAGGSFPMSAAPKPGETSINGALAGKERVYLIDSSVFPTIPASTITLSVMANAQRVAHHYIAKTENDGREQKMLYHG